MSGIRIIGTAVLTTNISPLDVVKENKSYLNFFKQPRGLKSGTLVTVEVIPATLERGIFKISYSEIAGSKEIALVPESFLDELSIAYGTAQKM